VPLATPAALWAAAEANVGIHKREGKCLILISKKQKPYIAHFVENLNTKLKCSLLVPACLFVTTVSMFVYMFFTTKENLINYLN